MKSTNESRKRLLRIGWVLGAIAGLLLTAFVVEWRLRFLKEKDYFVIPDETAVGSELLAQKFVGPRYFHVPEPVAHEAPVVGLDRPTHPYELTPPAAKAQIERVVQERRLPPGSAAKLNSLIDKLTEPPSTRVYGVSSVNVLRLNLALDALE